MIFGGYRTIRKPINTVCGQNEELLIVKAPEYLLGFKRLNKTPLHTVLILDLFNIISNRTARTPYTRHDHHWK
jgi:hypothetical protein